jgi:hypothetical protein
MMKCEEDFTAENAASIKEALLASTARKGDEILLLSEATAIDVIGIQLAFAWKLALQRQQRKAEVLLPQPESIIDLLKKTGITQLF